MAFYKNGKKIKPGDPNTIPHSGVSKGTYPQPVISDPEWVWVDEGEDKIEDINCSPLPKDMSVKLLSFSEAVIDIMKGKKITRLAWENSEIYIELFEKKLRIFRGDKDKLYYDWIINKIDLLAKDWIIL